MAGAQLRVTRWACAPHADGPPASHARWGLGRTARPAPGGRRGGRQALHRENHTIRADKPAHSRIVVPGMVEQQARVVQLLPGDAAIRGGDAADQALAPGVERLRALRDRRV